MPYDDPQLPTYPPGDVDTSGSASVEGPDLHFRWSSTEAAFWDRFVKTHPRPPEDIDREQSEIANKILTGQSYFEHRRNPARITASELARGEQLLVNNAVALGYPQEALTEEALLWSYIRNNNEQFQTEKPFGLSQESPAITNFIHFLAVDPKFVTQPLTQSQLLEANRWKTAYLRRLRSESADDSYINAYVKTWNLSAKDIFGGAKVSQ